MIPVLLKDLSPCEQLRPYVRKHQVFRFIFNKAVMPHVKFHTPRPEHCITFYVRDTQKFSYLNSTAIHTYPRCVINGIYTVPLYRYGGNDFLAIRVVLQPATLYRLLKLPVGELTNKFLDAEDIWGNDVRSVSQRLNELDDLSQMVLVIEAFLGCQIKKTKRYAHPIDKVPEYILNSKNDASLDWLADQSCLSKRQFIRKFEERIGISAKKFERIIHSDQTGKQISNVEVSLSPKQMGPAPHSHKQLDELMYVLEGTATVMIGKEIYEVEAGGWNFRPRGIIHSFWNASDKPLRFIDFFFNQNFEDYLEDLFHKIIPDMVKNNLNPTSPEIAKRIEVLDKKFGVTWFNNERQAIVDKYVLNG